MTKQTKIVAALSATALLALGASAVTFAAGWDNSTGNWQYIGNDGQAVADAWRKSGDYWFYLGPNGNMVTDQLINYNNQYYYVNGDGAMVANQWVAVSNADGSDSSDAQYRWYYFGEDGKAFKNNNTTLDVADLKTINGRKYAFDEDGKMLYGWVVKDGLSINTDDNAWAEGEYYFGGWDDGAASNGWVQLTVGATDSYPQYIGDDDTDKDTFWFYFDSNGKKTKNKKKNINGNTYYFDGEGRMVEEWSNTKASYNELTATSSNAYTNGDGASRKNQWVWAVPSKMVDQSDHDDDTYSWWWTDGSGKLVKNKIKNIKGKKYVFDDIGRMLSGLVWNTGSGYTNKVNSDDDLQDLTKNGYLAVAATSTNKIYFFSDDKEKDGSRKTGFQNVKFDDDTYQMYFKENGEAATGYFKNKYVIAGIVLKANNDDSNYALVETLPGQKTKLAAGFTEEKYANQVGFGTISGSWYLVNASGTRLDGKNKVYKDSNDVYYVTTSDGSVGYISNTQVWNSKSKDHENLVYQHGTRKYYTE